MKRTIWIYLLPAILLLAVTLPHLDQGDFRTDTARYAAVGLQAWQDHSLFWTPHLHPDIPYFNKPPLVFWIHGLALDWFGVNLIAARLPTILAAMGCVLLTIAITRRLMGQATALAAGAVLALTYEFFRRTREISLDMWQLCFMLAALWLAVEAFRRRSPHGFWLAGLPLGLALMCKPLMALLVVPILFAWMSGAQRPYPLAKTLLVALLVAAPWHVSMWQLHGNGFTAQYFGHEVIERALGRINHQPPWYYLAEMGRSYWPWILPAAAGIWYFVRRRPSPRHKAGLALAGIWLVVWGLAFTLFPDKRPRYELPLYPPLAMFAGYALVRLPWKGLRRWYRGKPLASTASASAAIGILVACLPLRVQAPPDPHLAAFIEWVRQAAPESVYAAALSTNDEGFFFLKTGHWPQPVWTSSGTRRVTPPEGAKLVYADGLDPSPGTNELIVFQSGPITVTQLGSGGWHPVIGTLAAEARQK